MPPNPRGVHGWGFQGEFCTNGLRKKSIFFRLASIPPGHVGSLWCRGGHVAGDLRHDALVKGAPTFKVRNVSSTHIAVGLSRTVFKVGDAKRVPGRVEKVL